MKKVKLLASVLALTGFGAITQVQAGEYQYVIRRIAPLPGMFCDDLAQSEAVRLKNLVATKDPSFALGDVRCVADDATDPGMASWNLKIGYTAEKPLLAVSTFDIESIWHVGFSKREECEATLTEESLRFAQFTKLTPFKSFCRLPYWRLSPIWEAEVIGFGTAELRPYTTSHSISGRLVGPTFTEVEQTIRQNFMVLKANLTSTQLVNELGSFEVRLNYFSKNRVILEPVKIANYDSPASCMNQVGAATAAMSDASLGNAVIYCNQIYGGTVILSALIATPSKFAKAETEADYDTAEICEAQKSAVIDHFRTKLNRDIKGGICSMYDDGSGRGVHYKIVMIEKRK